MTNVAVVPISPGAPLDAFCARLVAALGTHGRALHLTAAGVDARMAESGIAQAWDGGSETERLLAWLEARETDHRFVVYQADETADGVDAPLHAPGGPRAPRRPRRRRPRAGRRGAARC